MVPVRLAPLFLETRKVKVSLPLPLTVEASMVIQEALLTAVQEQPAAAVTDAVPVPPEEEKLGGVDAREETQDVGGGVAGMV
jgi:hypothetical protein